MDLPDLDYAYLARHAEVDRGLLNASGASFTRVQVERLPVIFPLSVAGRVRLDVECQAVPMRVAVSGPGLPTPEVAADLLVDPTGEFVYEGRVGVLFAVTMNTLLAETGLHQVTITLDGEVARRLMFSVDMSGKG